MRGSRRRGRVFGVSDLSLEDRQREYNRRSYERRKEVIKARVVERREARRERGSVGAPLAAPRSIRGWRKRLGQFCRGDVARALVLEGHREAMRLHDSWLESLDESEELRAEAWPW